MWTAGGAALRLALLAQAASFGRLGGGYSDQGLSHPHEGKVAEAGGRCHRALGHALGAEWMQCVVDELLEWQQAAKSEGRDDFFPVVNHTYHPLSAMAEHSREPGFAKHDLLKNLLRNVTCDIADGGSQPVRSFEWSFTQPDPCASEKAADPDADASPFVHKAGFMPAGHDLDELHGVYTEEDAKEVCGRDSRCQGFTFSGAAAPGAKHSMLFKSSDEVSMSPSWHTWKRRAWGGPLDCSLAARRARARPRKLRVDVLRESPPVYVVNDFLTDVECGFMMNRTIPHMGPSVVGGGGTSAWRRSYSVNMQPDFEDETHVFTQVARRKFLFARDVAGYAGLVEGDGQEPVNAVYYKDDGDQYRPHCDGECGGGKYSIGTRLATGLSYCEVADEGGYTLFTRSGLKVVPKPRQMLFFGYMFDHATPGEKMDHGLTEHTGCPLRRGKKWIATMWYREGVDAEKNWEYFSRRGAFGV